METIKNKVAFVTGGSRGIGQEIVRKLFSEGANVAFTYSNSDDEANQLALELSNEETKVIALKADSGSEKSLNDAINKAFEVFGSLDILINNAGVAINAMLPDVKMEDFDKMVAVNIKGVFVATQTAAALMNNGGRIITIGSVAAERTIFPGVSVYAMTKAAVAGLTRGIARDLAPRGITVNTVQPGPIETEMNPADSQFADIIRGFVPLGHYGNKIDVAELVAFLANPASKYITGACINIDGGLVC